MYLSGRWEDEVIWDHEKMPVKLQPRMVSMDPNDDNIILGIPEDIDPSTLPSDEPVRKVKIIQKHVKKSRMLLHQSCKLVSCQTGKRYSSFYLVSH